jgi:hypothetical protein
MLRRDSRIYGVSRGAVPEKITGHAARRRTFALPLAIDGASFFAKSCGVT